ncbi:MAG: nucleotidyltransferase domain-containing protein [Desulfovibrionales bacterium]|nr:MAG: nucleotidyltransferase domain-containing protein [Desulfovibrionales bacterium]
MLQKQNSPIQSAHDTFARKKILDQELARCLDVLKTKWNPKKVILFGTMAKGEVSEWSDIDLVVVEETSLPFYQRLYQVRKLLRPQVAMDVIVYTPDEFETMCAERAFMKDEVVDHGKVLYERSA